MIRSDRLRTQCIIEKIPGSVTGLRSAIYVHVDYADMREGRRIQSVRLSEKGKDESTLDRVCTAIGEVITSIIRREINVS